MMGVESYGEKDRKAFRKQKMILRSFCDKQLNFTIPHLLFLLIRMPGQQHGEFQ